MPQADIQRRDLDSVSTRAELAALLGVSEKRLLHILYARQPRYRVFKIPKRRGGMRIIEAPHRDLATLQRRFAAAIARVYEPKVTVNGFVTARGILRNARHHVGATLILNLDLKDFFPSIHFGRVLGALQSHPFNLRRGIAATLARLCCNDGRLPQGAPSSPILSNVVCRSLDQRLSVLGRSVGAKYSRYADDITFSTASSTFSSKLVVYDHERATPVLGDTLVAAIEGEGFFVAPEKTRIRAKTVRQEVTGLTVNVKPNVHRNFVRSLRGALWCWTHMGYDEANTRLARYVGWKGSESRPSLVKHLQGKLAYLRMVRGAGDPLVAEYSLRFAKLAGRRTLLMGEAALNARNLVQALWLVWGIDADGNETGHATAFFLEGVGFVTCHHAFDATGCREPIRWKVVRPEKPALSFDLTMKKSDEHFDFAIFDAPAACPWAALVPGDSDALRTDAAVTLAGFPNWAPGQEEGRVQRGHVVQRKTASLKKLIETSCSVHSGNSGGPLLDVSGRVVGIALYDASSSILPNSALDICHLLA